MTRKRSMLFQLIFGILFVFLPASSMAAVLTVGTGGTYSTIQDGVDAASDGDVVLVNPGTYGEEILIHGKCIAVIADGSPVYLKGSITVENTSLDQEVVLSGLSCSFDQTNIRDNLILQSAKGSVRVEDCIFQGCGVFWPTTNAATVDQCADVVFINSAFHGGSQKSLGGLESGAHGLEVIDSNIAIYGCILNGGGGSDGFGGEPPNPGEDGGCACVCDSSVLFSSGSDFLGGPGGDGGGSVYYSGGEGGDGGHGLWMKGASSEAWTLDCTFTGGDGGGGGTGYNPGFPGSDGLPEKIDGGLRFSFSESSRDFLCPSLCRENSSIDLTFHGYPGEKAFLIAGLDPGFLFLEEYSGMWLVALHPTTLIVPMGVIPAGGSRTCRIPVPYLDPMMTDMTLYLQSVMADGLGGAVIGTPQMLIILDEAY